MIKISLNKIYIKLLNGETYNNFLRKSGVKIGNNCVIGVGAIVTKNIPDDSIAAGIPAKVIKSLAEYEKYSLLKSDDTKSLNNIDKKSYLLKNFFG
ncbi:TPA: hypothetical protein U1C26_001971 [Streptococcus suis]|nr:hypothetical protein [Streptococcus suis]